jgi:hypothetical protein
MAFSHVHLGPPPGQHHTLYLGKYSFLVCSCGSRGSRASRASRCSRRSRCSCGPRHRRLGRECLGVIVDFFAFPLPSSLKDIPLLALAISFSFFSFLVLFLAWLCALPLYPNPVPALRSSVFSFVFFFVCFFFRRTLAVSSGCLIRRVPVAKNKIKQCRHAELVRSHKKSHVSRPFQLPRYYPRNSSAYKKLRQAIKTRMF